MLPYPSHGLDGLKRVSVEILPNLLYGNVAKKCVTFVSFRRKLFNFWLKIRKLYEYYIRAFFHIFII